ncbi:hypothetical protein I311_06085 [Cryptococcus gattii NT-10]|nr:hypothetical protein I311_06085 [Cryptococcus gattii NT-10]
MSDIVKPPSVGEWTIQAAEPEGIYHNGIATFCWYPIVQGQSFILSSNRLDLFREGKIAHVAFVHPGDEEGEGTKRRKETIMKISAYHRVGMRREDEDDQDSYVVYLHSHKYSGLVEASTRGSGNFTATTTRSTFPLSTTEAVAQHQLAVDSLVLSPTAHDHSLSYPSATLHLHKPAVLSDQTDHEEKRDALAAITNTILGYDGTTLSQVLDSLWTPM